MKTGRDCGSAVLVRYAKSGDAEAIAGIHADSWRQHYRGAFQDSYLDGDIFAERVTAWRERLTGPQANSFTVVAEIQSSIVGFAHVVLDSDPHWGALLDNLHVTFQLKRRGIGQKLLQAVAARLLQRGKRSFHLWVLDQNVAAQRFYTAQGGRRVETRLRGPFPGGGFALGHRISWANALELVTLTVEQHKG